MTSDAVYTVSIEVLDLEQAVLARKRAGIRTRPYQVHDPTHLDTPTGLPADLDREARQSTPPSDTLVTLLQGWAASLPPLYSSALTQDRLNPQATAFAPSYSRKSKFSTTIKPPFEPFRRLDWRFGKIFVDMQDEQKQVTDAVDVGFGIIRLRRQPLTPNASAPPNKPKPSSSKQLQDASSEPPLPPVDVGDGCTLAILALPPVMTISDFLQFVAPGEEMISQIRILRDEAASRSLALMRFRSATEAELFRDEFNAKPFWAMSPDELCHVVQVASIEVRNTSMVPFTFPSTASVEDANQSATASSSSAAATELPSCVVCLERLDSNITGLITIPCHHTFHCSCLSKWASGKCPVCRYTQNLAKVKSNRIHDDEFARTTCDQCGSSEKLWMCLICGHAGGGRYACRHAVSHFEQSGHLYAMELETQRVWDYAGDAYVHRLIQNQSDGKLVELPSVGSSQNDQGKGREGPDSAAAEAQGKTEKMAQEFSNLLISQLDSQRSYFLDKMSELKQELFAMMDQEEQMRLSSEVQDNRLAKSRAELATKATENQSLAERLDRLEQETVPQLRKDKERVEKKLDKANETIRTLQRDFSVEKSLASSLHDRLRESQEAKQKLEEKLKGLDLQLKEAQDMNQDLIHNLDWQTRMMRQPELQGSSIMISDMSRANVRHTRQQNAPQNVATATAATKNKKKKKPKKPPQSMHVNPATEESPAVAAEESPLSSTEASPQAQHTPLQETEPI